MIREEAIFCEKSYIGETNCIDCKYCGTETCQSRESHRMAIKALEKEPILDKIRTEIKKEIDRDDHADEYCDGYYDGMRNALAIIDKYKAESEE